MAEHSMMPLRKRKPCLNSRDHLLASLFDAWRKWTKLNWRACRQDVGRREFFAFLKSASIDRAVMFSSVPVKDKIIRCFAFKLIQHTMVCKHTMVILTLLLADHFPTTRRYEFFNSLKNMKNEIVFRKYGKKSAINLCKFAASAKGSLV